MKRVEVDNTQNLDLNTTARKNEKTMEKFSPYLNLSTYGVIQANLTHPIGVFDEAKEMALLYPEVEDEEGVASAVDMKKDASKGKLASRKSSRGSEGGQSTKDLGANKELHGTGMTGMS